MKKETLQEAAEIDLTKLCFYDKRNPDFQIKEEYGYDKEEVETTGNYSKKDCACDNCFYGRSNLTEQLILQQERSYSEDELKSAFKIGFNIGYGSPVSELDLKQKHCDKWFEQFKKK